MTKPLPPEQRKQRGAHLRGKRHSEEAKARRAETMRAYWAAKTAQQRAEHGRKSVAALTPEGRESRARASSARMRERHRTDAEFQKRRDERSSRVLKAVWARPEMRQRLVQGAVERYASGLGQAEVKARSKSAAKWIMKHANAELRAETDFVQVFTETYERMRREHPYDGPQDKSDYMDYLARLARLVQADPALRKLCDEFMATAIPRWADEWKRRRSEERAAVVSGATRDTAAS